MNDFFYVLQSEYLGYFWLIIAVILLLSEVTTPGLFFFIAFAVGSCVAAIIAFLGYSLFSQCLIGLGVSLVSFFILRYFFASRGRNKFIRTNTEAIVGKSGVVIKQIKPHGVGLVKVEGEVWSAESDQVIGEGLVVIVVNVRGNRVIVKS